MLTISKVFLIYQQNLLILLKINKFIHQKKYFKNKNFLIKLMN